jgi:hypothetical protein
MAQPAVLAPGAASRTVGRNVMARPPSSCMRIVSCSPWLAMPLAPSERVPLRIGVEVGQTRQTRSAWPEYRSGCGGRNSTLIDLTQARLGPALPVRADRNPVGCGAGSDGLPARSPGCVDRAQCSPMIPAIALELPAVGPGVELGQTHRRGCRPYGSTAPGAPHLGVAQPAGEQPNNLDLPLGQSGRGEPGGWRRAAWDRVTPSP